MKTEYPRYKQGELDSLELTTKKDKEALAEYLKKCSITACEKKVTKIKKIILQFYDVTELPITEQTIDSVNSFLVVLKKSDKSHWTKDEIRIYVKQFLLRYYKNLEMIENFKFESKKGLNPHKITENNLITEKDIERMIRHADNYKEKSYLLLAFQTGARPQELAELRWRDIQFDDVSANINLFSNKTKQSRSFPVVEQTKKALWELKQHYTYEDLKPNDYVFSSPWRDRPMTSAGFNKMLRRISKAANLGKDVWNYLLRHTRATRLYEELSQPIVEKLMGHKNQAGIYAHISSKKAKEELLSKIYKLQDMPPEKKEEFEKAIDELKKEAVKNKIAYKKIQDALINNKDLKQDMLAEIKKQIKAEMMKELEK